MRTNDERREVAERMRVYSHDFDFGDSDPFWYVAKAAFGDADVHTYYSVFARLADLIDPTCHLGPAHFGGFGCDRCFTWFPDMKKRTSHCPECGAMVVDDE
ncbi:hypothetical protein [Parafannyhessea umbonata]|uniref:Uncharacterized protein n=1 Tax=Parafannyhessea umbonata TaxID=604330 RepID=A0A1H1L3C3_9ACTN|nr:hypothetical protein [Parafannyhessea umbonata]SDR69081.1 hypothetical protein SAMN04489857_0668 [Parafannyhessea umbonata]